MPGLHFRYRCAWLASRKPSKIVQSLEGLPRVASPSRPDARSARSNPRSDRDLQGGHACREDEPLRRRVCRRNRGDSRPAFGARSRETPGRQGAAEGISAHRRPAGLSEGRPRDGLRGRSRDRDQRPIRHRPDARRHRRPASCRGLPAPDGLEQDDLAQRADLAQPPTALLDGRVRAPQLPVSRWLRAGRWTWRGCSARCDRQSRAT